MTADPDRVMIGTDQIYEGEYLCTTIEYTHPEPRLRSNRGVSVRLQMDYDELVGGATIDVWPSETEGSQ